MANQINVNNEWRNVGVIYINVNGTWRTVTDGYINVNGVWKTMYTQDITAPTAPTVTASSAGASSINVSWSGATDNIAILSYKVYRSDTGVNGTYNQLTTTASTFYTDNAVSTGTTYYYKVKTVDTSGNESSLSSASNGVTLASITIYAESTVVSENYIWWNGGTTNTRLYRSINTNTAYNLIFTDTSAIGSYTDSGLIETRRYYYKVSNDNGATFSDEVWSYPNGIPA